MTTGSRPLRLAASLTLVVAALGCAPHASSGAEDGDEESGEGPPAVSVDSLGTWRVENTRANNLRDGEVVLTFDDGPARSSAEVAALLAARGHVGLFFVVSKHLGSASGGAVRLDDTGVAHLRAVVDAGQLVGNHTHDHCIAGASACGGRAFAALAATEQRRQVELTDLLVRSALDRIGRPAAYLPFFRAPGNSWNARTADNLASANVVGPTYGPIGWEVPAPGDEDFRCWSAGTSVSSCASRYVSAFRALPAGSQKAVILIHDNFANAAALTRGVLDGLVGTRTKAGNPVRVAHPRCLVGCTR